MNTGSDQSNVATLIVVLGMHRSGTSVVARAMGALGGEFGERLLPPVAGVNDKGFFEDIDVNAINAEIMKAAGLDWYSMAPVDLESVDPSLLDRLQTKAVALLREKCDGVGAFVLKDPRLTRLLPFWKPVFSCLGMRVEYVVAVRNPISVVKSLLKSHHIPEEKSYILWLAHIIPALEDTRDLHRIFIEYDRLMEAPAREIVRVSEYVGLTPDQTSLQEFEQEFLQRDLRSSRFNVNDLDVVRAAPPQIKEVFGAMQRIAAADTSASDKELDSAVRSGRLYLDSVSPILRHEWRLVRHIEEITPMLTSSTARIEELGVALHENVERAASEMLIRDQAVVQLHQTVADGHRGIQELGQHLEESQRYANDLKQHLESSQRYANDLKQHLESSQLYASELESRVEQLTAQVEALTLERDQEERSLEALELRAAQQEAELQRAGDRIVEFANSTSWKITAPLRAVRRLGSSNG
jgi:hypothetical protein